MRLCAPPRQGQPLRSTRKCSSLLRTSLKTSPAPGKRQWPWRIGPEGHFTELGRVLALELTASLGWSGKDLEATHTNQLGFALNENGLKPADQFDPRVARRLGERAGAAIVVLGRLETDGIRVTLLRAVQAADNLLVREVEGTLPSTPVVEKLLARRLYPLAAAPRPEGPVSSARDCSGFGSGVRQTGRDGVSFPKCVACPNPGYSEEARKRGISGYVLLLVVVTDQGTADQIRVIKRVGYGLDEQAVNAVKKWRFEPATSREGKAVTTCTPIEISFRVR